MMGRPSSSASSTTTSNNNDANKKHKQETAPLPPHDLLLSPKALELSLSPPRAPPFGSLQRTLLTGGGRAVADYFERTKNTSSENPRYHVRRNRSENNNSSESQQQEEEAHSRIPHETLRQRLRDQFRHHLQHNRHHHPHLAEQSADAVTRQVGLWWSVPRQNQFRDGGYFRAVADGLVVWMAAPLLLLRHPQAAAFEQARLAWQSQTLRYGPHPRQTVDLYWPESSTDTDDTTVRRLIFFCHGGAWGSGAPWMYRLLAVPYLQQGWAVAVPGYRTYPDCGDCLSTSGGGVMEQVRDLEGAAAAVQGELRRRRKSSTNTAGKNSTATTKVTLMGHSSGAHIALLMLVERARQRLSQQQQHLMSEQQRLQFDSFVGLSGPYDIEHHYDYEAGRGVEELSPMKPVNGYTRTQFRRHSPARALRDDLLRQTTTAEHQAVSWLLPRTMRLALFHGMEDDTVPFTATAEAARVLRSCGVTTVEEVYLPDTGHQDMVLQIMLGGRARDGTVEWIRGLALEEESSSSSSVSCGDGAEEEEGRATRQRRQKVEKPPTRILVQSKL